MHEYAFFDTTLGRCAIAWGQSGIAAVELPGSDDRSTRRRIERALPGAVESTPPADVKRAIEEIVALFEGEPRDLATLALDMDDVPEFERRVYETARTVLPGETITYGEIAASIGEHGAAQ